MVLLNIYVITIGINSVISNFIAHIYGKIFLHKTKEKIKIHNKAVEQDKNAILILKPDNNIPNVFEMKEIFQKH